MNFGSSDVIKLSRKGVQLGVFNVGSGPEECAFDGTSIWVVNTNAGTLSKL